MPDPMYGWVILAWNPHNGLPRVAVEQLYDTERDALARAASLRGVARSSGRGERYTVHPLDDEIAGADQ